MARTITPIALIGTDADLRAAFAALADRADVASLLGISDRELIYILYRGGKNYIEFDVPKKSGGARHIAAPASSIKILQKRLNQVLQLVYPPKATVHGFTLGRSIVTNADRHVRKRLIFNVDLEDFFPSIHFGRVRGVFASEPYNLPHDVAQVLAQICTHNSALPQGAPTSPIISNMVCSGLDGGLRRLAQTHGCTYTRYADDLTFSTTRRAFPPAIVTNVPPSQNAKAAVAVGEGMRQVIEGNSFRINAAKVRLRGDGQRREVTGLIVGKGINIPREFVRDVRGLLHAWERYGHDDAEAELRARHHQKHRRPGSPPVSLLAVAAGKLEFIRMVRGPSDLLYTKLWNRFARLAGPDYRPKLAVAQTAEQVDAALWVLESETDQGTAFMLDGVGLVTCAHCLGEGPLIAYQPALVTTRYAVRVTHRCDERDLALLQFEKLTPVAGLRLGNSALVKNGDPTIAAGCGNYAKGHSSRLIRGFITGRGHRDPVPEEVFFSDHRAFEGQSGGPVLTDAALSVIGVLQRAGPEQETTVLPISLLSGVPKVKE